MRAHLPQNCESECTRGDVDDPIAIDEIKSSSPNRTERRTALRAEDQARYDQELPWSAPDLPGFLRLLTWRWTAISHRVRKTNRARWDVDPGHSVLRLEKDVVNAEIDVLKDLGVEFKLGVEVGRDVSLDDLRSQGYAASTWPSAPRPAEAQRRSEDAPGVIAGWISCAVSTWESSAAQWEGHRHGGGNVAIE